MRVKINKIGFLPVYFTLKHIFSLVYEKLRPMESAQNCFGKEKETSRVLSLGGEAGGCIYHLPQIYEDDYFRMNAAD